MSVGRAPVNRRWVRSHRPTLTHRAPGSCSETAQRRGVTTRGLALTSA